MSEAERLRDLEIFAQLIANVIAPAFDAALEHNMVFAVLGYTVGERGSMTYVSNGDRECMIKSMREMADKLEREKDMPAGPFLIKAALQ